MNRQLKALLLAACLLPPLAMAADEPARVSVTDISVLGNTLLPPATLEAALAPYKGSRSMADIRQAAQVVQDLYRQAGYGAVVSFLPEQAVAGGRLVIGVLEGRVARVEVLGNQRFGVDNVRRAVPELAVGRTPHVRRIDRQVQLANENPARKLAVTLEPGRQRGEVDAVVTVSEEPTTRWTAFADNSGNAQTGRMRLGLAYQHAALWDRDHQFSAQAQFAPEHPGRVRIFGASYRAPLYGAGLMVNAFGFYSNVDAGSTATAAGAMQFNGKGRAAGVSVTRLLQRLGEFDQRVSVSLENRDYLNDCSIQGLPAGACGSAGESVTVQPLSLEYTLQRGGERGLGLQLGLLHNLKLGGRHATQAQFDAVRPGAAQRFSVLRLTAHAALPLAADWALQSRLSAQASSDALVVGEQFGAAGANAVRGYEEREVTGDSGAAASVELLTPGLFGNTTRLLLFADAGTARNRLGTWCDNTQASCQLAAWGLGARFVLGRSQWQVDVAQALQDGRSTASGDSRVHVQASIAFP